MTEHATMNDAGPATPNGAAPSEIGNLIADIEEVLGKAADVVDLDVSKLRDSLRQKLAMARLGLLEGRRKVTDAANSAAHATDHYVHSSPWQAIGIAAAAGLVAGYLLARR